MKGASSAALAGVLAAASAARAQGSPPAAPMPQPGVAEPVALEWEAPPGCPGRDEVLTQIQKLSPPGEMRARAVVSQVDGGTWSAEVALLAGADAASRRVVGDSCRGVADAVALIVALAVAPEPAAPPPPPEPSPPPLPAASPREEPLSEPPARSSLALGGSFQLDSATLPAVSAGGAATIGWHRPHLALEIEGALLAPVRGSTAARPEEGADFWLAHVGAHGCYEILNRPIDLGPCLGAGLEWTVAHGVGSQAPANATGTAGVLTFGGRVRLLLAAPFHLRLGIEGAAPTARPTYVILGTGFVYQPPAVAVRGTGGVEVDF